MRVLKTAQDKRRVCRCNICEIEPVVMQVGIPECRGGGVFVFLISLNIT